MSEPTYEEGSSPGEQFVAEKAESDRGSYWAEVIRQQGGGYLNGKFDEDWFDPSKNTSPTTEGHERANEFSNPGSLGKLANGNNWLGNSVESANLLSATLTKENAIADGFNYLILLPGDHDSGMPNDGEYQGFVYEMWSHGGWTPDARGHHVPLEFVFYLPQADKTNFLNEIVKNPDILEQTFQANYPGLSERGLQRVTAKGFKFFSIGQKDGITRSETERVIDKVRNSDNYLLFSHSMGEQRYS